MASQENPWGGNGAGKPRLTHKFSKTKDAASVGFAKTKVVAASGFEKTKVAAMQVKDRATVGVNWIKLKLSRKK
ncbi:hypothetical protein OROGR_001435 [Orobanche gracilis]